MEIAVTYCGGCNPDIDRERLVNELEDRLGQALIPLKKTVTRADLLLLVSGCSRNCLDNSHPEWGKRAIIVSGLKVNGWPVSKENILTVLYNKIKGSE